MVLTLKLFGAPGIEREGELVTGRAAQGRRLALLAYLALARSRVVTRDKIIAVLWPESPAERARQRLSDDLYIIRSAIGDDAVQTRGDELALHPDRIASDVGTFERLLEAGQTESAVQVYAGPLLDGFHLADSPEFDQWLESQRSRLAQRHAAALESLAVAREAGSDFGGAVEWWQRLASQDPGNGRVTLRLMRALDAAGDRAGALRHARLHAALMREEFDADPDPQVSQFAERLRVDPTERSGAAVDTPARPRTRVPPVARVETTDAMPVESVAGHTTMSAPRAAPTGTRLKSRRMMLVAGAGLVLTLAALLYRNVALGGLAPPAIASIGVMPFVNMGTDTESQYFGDGLAEQIITALSGMEGLRVAARTSSFALRDHQLDIRAIGDTLGVAAVLEGSIRRSGNRLRITAQLVDASTGYQLWSDAYDRELRDLFVVQDEIAGAIAGALRGRLNATGAPPQVTPDLPAYELYLKALYLRNSLAPSALRQAEDLLDSVIAREPRFALAYAAQASIIAPQILFGVISSTTGIPKLRALTARALALDSTLGEAHATLGVQQLFFDWDWSGAERSLRRAIALNPSDAHAYHHLANWMNAMGRRPEAIAARMRAAQLDPLNARTAYTLASDYFGAGDYDKAMTQFRIAVRLDPSHTFNLGSGPFLPQGPAEVYLAQNQLSDAVDEYLRIAALRGATAQEVSALRQAFARSGMKAFWRRWIDMDIRQSDGAPDALRLAKLWVLAGDTPTALSWLERAYADRHPALIYLRSDKTLQLLHGEARVQHMLKEMGLGTK